MCQIKKKLYTFNKCDKNKYKLRISIKKGKNRSYFSKEIKKNYLVKMQKKCSTALNYIKQSLTLDSDFTGCVSILLLLL